MVVAGATPVNILIPFTSKESQVMVWSLGEVPISNLIRGIKENKPLYPAGYQSTKWLDGKTYRQAVLVNRNRLLFQVTDEFGHHCKGLTPSAAWESLGLMSNPDGDKLFGFTDPIIRQLIVNQGWCEEKLRDLLQKKKEEMLEEKTLVLNTLAELGPPPEHLEDQPEEENQAQLQGEEGKAKIAEMESLYCIQHRKGIHAVSCSEVVDDKPAIRACVCDSDSLYLWRVSTDKTEQKACRYEGSVKLSENSSNNKEDYILHLHCFVGESTAIAVGSTVTFPDGDTQSSVRKEYFVKFIDLSGLKLTEVASIGLPTAALPCAAGVLVATMTELILFASNGSPKSSHTFPNKWRDFTSMSIIEGGKLIASACHAGVVVWSLVDDKLEPVRSIPSSSILSHSNHTLVGVQGIHDAVSSQLVEKQTQSSDLANGTVFLVREKCTSSDCECDARRESTQDINPEDKFPDLKLSPGIKKIVSSAPDLYFYHLSVWDPRVCIPSVQKYTFNGENLNISLSHIPILPALSTDRYIIGATSGGQVPIWRVMSGKLAAVLREHEDEILFMGTIDVDSSRMFVTAGREGRIFFHKLAIPS